MIFSAGFVSGSSDAAGSAALSTYLHIISNIDLISVADLFNGIF
jgi:hypothetical protein